MNHEALFWEYDKVNEVINCNLCPHHCKLSKNKIGICKTRQNIDNTLIALNYGKVASIALDPIEKKPLYHYKPGSNILSLGTYGCNMRCGYCQNYSISQSKVKGDTYNVEYVLQLIDRTQDNIGIAFTYNEPLMWYEYVLETAKAVKAINKDVVLVTNGYINQEPLELLLNYVDSMNIDLKSFDDKTYHKLCNASLDPVLNTIKVAARKVHLEVTTLLVTNANDTLAEVEAISKFLSLINPNIVLHLSRYFPRYKLNDDATDINFMKTALLTAKKYLHYVYIGNLNSQDNNSYCHHCGDVLVQRNGYQIKSKIVNTLCPNCKKEIPFII